MKPRLTFLIILASFFLSAGQTQPSYSSDSLAVVHWEDSIVVVGNRYEIPLKNLGHNLQIYSSEQLQALGNHSVLEAIDLSFPSAFVVDKKIMGYGVGREGAGQVFLRGLGGKPNTGVLVLVNGHPDFMGIFGHPLPDVYGLEGIDRVEILAGAASTVFGDHAMGGVVNIVTRSVVQEPFILQVEGGNYKTYKVGLQSGFQKGRHSGYITIQRQYSGGHLEQTMFLSHHLVAGWNYQLSPHLELQVRARYVPYDFDDPSREADTPKDVLGVYGKIRRGMGELVLQNRFSRLEGSVQLYTNLGHHRFWDGFESRDFTHGFSIYQQYKYRPGVQLAGGLDILHYGGKANVDNQLHRLTSVGGYLIGILRPVSFLNVQTGLRFQYLSLPLTVVSPSISVSFRVFRQSRLFLGYHSGFRYPTLMELYLFPVSNDQLKEERVNSFEAGGMVTFGRLSLQLSYFMNDVWNLIQKVNNPAAPPPVIFRNSGKARQHGIEAQITLRRGRHFQQRFAYSYLQPDQLTAFNPAHQFKYWARYQTRRLAVDVYGKYVYGLYASNNEKDRLPDYDVLNAAVSLRWGAVDFQMKLLNILNRSYWILPDYPAPGFQLRVGMVYHMR
ncbi:MAG: TonB-dependent receptor [Calditrichaeota bacterium]|nr:TonB-dependent receptor [Calditrichota bacterium]